ncbi:LysR family transcriptional regulator [Caballeronia choica]|jgi:DNA-binding transcriptional LysR family regulator|uniref:LysR family transcriptional regulator n=1 Tax=Caballeronia choica TaxID=326476 RepID=A0A158JN65_9BURK|nr:LysR substrate-binding domain-containing protein [Caballeronia choica]SAL70326.1 LysR family transcriptional regulator [Caballeronia choica]
MHISLRLLRYFTAAAQTGSTTAAAKELNVSQPSISVAIRELEGLFGEDLFARGSGTRMTLTRFGMRKLDEARQLLKAAAAFEADDGGDPASGEVQIGVFSTIAPVYLPRVLRIARERYPNLTVRFVEGDLAQLETWLRSGHIELALTYDVALPADIERECLAELHPYALVGADTRLARMRGTIPLAELAKEPFILIDLPHSRDFLIAPFWQFGLAPEIRYRATSIELVRGMVASGLGVSLLITQSAAGAQTPGIVERPIREATVRQPLVIARASGAVRTQASGLLADCVRDAVAHAMLSRARRGRRTNPSGQLPT